MIVTMFRVLVPMVLSGNVHARLDVTMLVVDRNDLGVFGEDVNRDGPPQTVGREPNREKSNGPPATN